MKLPDALDRTVLYFTYFGQYVHIQGRDFTSQFTKSELSADHQFTLNRERAIFTILRQIVAEGQQNGQIRDDLPAERITAGLLRFARGIAIHWCISKGAYDLAEEVTRSAKLCTLRLKPQTS